jgi:hypothetical protein
MAAPDENFASVLRDQIDMCRVASMQMPKNDQVCLVCTDVYDETCACAS